jgi:tRNA pseudouridine38-40 synthase
MRTLKLILAYDGTEYAGWQSQPHGFTLQDALESAIARITGGALRVTASGRTDAGVHALGQVVSFITESRLSLDVLHRALNAHLPRDIVVLSVDEVREGFHAIRDAKRKRYRYVIQDGPIGDVFRRRFAWHVFAHLHVAAMQRAAQSLVGTHDFCSFQSAGADRETTVRTLFEISLERGRGAGEEDVITLEIEADGFLYNMVRTIVGTLVQVGRGTQPESWPGEVLRALDRRAAGQTAPPHGLFLVDVKYE